MQAYTPKREQALDACLAIVPSILSPNHHDECDKIISLKDLKEDLGKMGNDKTHRLDGFPCDFYK